MPLDAICLSALTSELSDKLTGWRIDKVQQPDVKAALQAYLDFVIKREK